MKNLGVLDSKLAIAVVIPAYRTADRITRVLQTIPEFVSTIVVVDDASPDDLHRLVSECAQVDPRIHLVHHPINKGVGGAMLTGYKTALALKAGLLVKMDSDGQMDPAYIQPMLAPILSGKADYTKGNRFLHNNALAKMPVIRLMGNLALSFLTKAASGYWNIFDPTNGFTAMHASLFQMLDIDQIAQDYFFETSMLIELSIRRAVVRDVYIPAVYVGASSSLSELKSLYTFPVRLMRGCLRRILIQYFIRDFNTLSLLLVSGLVMCLFGMVWGGFHWWRSIAIGIPATTGTVMLAVLPLILGVQFLLQALMLDIQNVPTQPLNVSGDTELWSGQPSEGRGC
jgi:glycosyltransferase involved in cell wall biosynthesis